MVLQRLAAAPRLDQAQCAVLRVQGESMEPTLPAGSSILLDRCRTRRRDGQISVLRAAKGEDGGWWIADDNPAWEAVAFPDAAVVLGRIVWTARALA